MEVTPAPGRRERKKLETWRKIRHVALNLILERGYSTVSLEDIARAADVSRATLFNYFPSKEAMLFAPDPEEQQRWQAFLDARPKGEHPWTTLEAFFLDYTAGYETKLRLQKQLQAEVAALRQGNQDVSERLSAFLTDWLGTRLHAQGRDPQDAALLSALAFTVMGVVFARWQPDEPFIVFQDLLRTTFRRAGQGLTSTL
ncbi:TetR/AcrR family transcriptional regulator [Deinococcus sp. 14RED07]|uniref:TetR/AcrR family transcriptional regulator n=1 Tax=Deinococcus sp. 14RED07 TaxID=2745874 RepID=UPI001E48F4CC|nr:TetR/AcrR family transcriptional regulator [Deinococcus sp. 14RED07]